MISEAQLWGVAGALFVGLVLFMLGLHAQNRRDARKDREAQHERDIKFETLLEEYGLHSHNEMQPGAPASTPLLVGGMRKASARIGRGRE